MHLHQETGLFGDQQGPTHVIKAIALWKFNIFKEI